MQPEAADAIAKACEGSLVVALNNTGRARSARLADLHRTLANMLNRTPSCPELASRLHPIMRRVRESDGFIAPFADPPSS